MSGEDSMMATDGPPDWEEMHGAPDTSASDARCRVRALLAEVLELDGNDELPHSLTDGILAFLKSQEST